MIEPTGRVVLGRYEYARRWHWIAREAERSYAAVTRRQFIEQDPSLIMACADAVQRAMLTRLTVQMLAGGVVIDEAALPDGAWWDTTDTTWINNRD